MAIGYRACYRI